MLGRTIVVHRTPHMYCSHASIALGPGGEWIVAFCAGIQREPVYLHPTTDPSFVNVLSRSYDQGETWEAPRVVPGYDWYGIETPGIACISSGEVLLNQWRFLWYPLEEARKRSAAGEELFVCDPVVDPHDHLWRRVRTEADWERHPFPYARAEGGAYVHISADGGDTWGLTVPLDTEPYQGAFSPNGAIELADGDLMLALGSQNHDPLSATFVVRSGDKGRSWGRPVEVARVRGLRFSEPSVVETATGGLLVFSREETTGRVYQSESRDGGRTWDEPEPFSVRGLPAHAIRLRDGRLMLVYGRRDEPFGIRAAVSEDQGASWGPELVIREDLPSDNLGYPSVIEYAPGKLFTVYYGEDGDGSTCIQATYFAV